MNASLSKLFFYYPATFIKGEPVALLMNRYRKNQWRQQEQLEKYRHLKLQNIISYAYRHSSYYKAIYDKAGIRPEQIKSISDFSKLPIITKLDLIDNLPQILTRRHWPASEKTTGGSTGQPVRLYKNPLALARERCATWRAYEWAGVSIGDPQLRFWGIPHSSSDARKASITDLIANRRRVSAFNLTENSLERYYHEAIFYKPSYLYGYVSAIEQLANHIIDRSLPPPPSIRAVITTSEVLTDGSRDRIQSAFKTKVYNEYGCGEVGSIAHECDAGSMHIMADNLYIEVDSAGDTGELLVTDFFNYATPLIRYRLGDYATLTKDTCECGRSLPLIQSIHGRAYDLIKLPSGRSIHPEAIIYIFEALQRQSNGFKQFQVVQANPLSIEIKIIANKNWSPDLECTLLNQLKKNIDAEIEYRVNLTSEIPREPSGKMRLVKRLF